MQCPACNAPLEEDTVFCGNCGRQVAPLLAKGATIAAPAEELQALKSISTLAGENRPAQPAMLQTPSTQTPPYAPTTAIPVHSATPQLPTSTRPRLTRTRRQTL